jgi:hypothetical protein
MRIHSLIPRQEGILELKLLEKSQGSRMAGEEGAGTFHIYHSIYHSDDPSTHLPPFHRQGN